MLIQDANSTSPRNVIQSISNFLRKNKTLIGYWFIDKMKVSEQELEPVPTIFNKIGDFLLKPFVNKNLIPQILMGPFSFQIFKVSHDLGLFSYLNTNPGATIEEICLALKIEKYPAEILLLGLTGLKLIKKIGQVYYNCGVTKIVTQNQDNKFTHFYPKYMQYAHHILTHGIHYLHESVTENRPVGMQRMFGEQAQDYYYELSKNETKNHYFAQHMSAFSQINAHRLSSLPLFGKIHSLLDIGGGIGDVAISIAKLHPNLKITVFDHPSVAEIANKRFRDANLNSRLNAVGADVMSHPFPQDYEGILFSHFIDIFSPEVNIDFFTRAFNALKPGGNIIIYTPVVDDNENGPMVNCLLGVYFLCLANGKGRFYTGRQITAWMKNIGFTNITIKRLPSSEAILIGTKP